MTEKLTLKKLKQYKGREIILSDWMEITQDRINAFAECTEDRQWIHVDEKRAKKGPLSSTLAHGFLLLSLLPYLNLKNDIFSLRSKMAVNYGLNRVRFINPVKPGNYIRNRAVLKDITKKGFRKVLLSVENTIEIKDQEKPALAAETLALFYL